MKNPKFDNRSTKQYLNSNVQMTKTFGIWNFCYLNPSALFRTSLFRISHARVFFYFLPSVFCFLSSVFCLLSVAGCQNTNTNVSLAEQVKQLTEQNTKLIRQIERSELEKEQLKKQVQTLSGLPEKVRLENLYNLAGLKIGKYTNFFDKDKDGKKEKLIVYIEPIDDQGDFVKASGTVDVQLWDLNKNEGEPLLGKWRVEPNELKKLWFATLIKINYRLTFDVADKIEGLEEPLTLKVTFTDYLSGKVFNEQKVIKP